MLPYTSFLVLLCISTLEHVREISTLTNVFSEKLGLNIYLTSQDNLLDVVDPRKLIKFIDEMDDFKTELFRTKQYYQYCGKELKFDVGEFIKWVEYAIAKIDTELEFAMAITKMIHKKSRTIDLVFLEMNIEQLDNQIIEKAFKELKILNNFLGTSLASKCVDRLKKMHEVSEEIFGKFAWLRKLYRRVFRKEDSSEEIKVTKPRP